MAEVKEAPKAKTENGAARTTEMAPRAPGAPLAPVGGSPFAFLRRFAQEMDSLFEEFGMASGVHMPRLLSRGREMIRREAGLVPAEWSPRIDVVEREGQFIVRADLPGMNKDDVKVDVGDGMLTIQGERKHEKKEEREGYAYSECSYGSFYRAIPLPEGADVSKASAEFKKGVLEITLPAPAAPKTKRLEVREGRTP